MKRMQLSITLEGDGAGQWRQPVVGTEYVSPPLPFELQAQEDRP